MNFSAITNNPQGRFSTGTDKSFREADFLAIMLTEITHQDPFEPQETSKLVENMQKLQDLATSNYEKFRADIRWAQDLVGETIVVSQSNLSPDEVAILAERGVNPDIGYASITGPVESFRTVGETVWVTVGGKDYPIDNIQQVTPAGTDPSRMATIADGLLGRTVLYYSRSSGLIEQGQVKSVNWERDGRINVVVGDQQVPFEDIRSINP